MKNHTQNVLEKLFADPYLKNQNWAYLWINGLKFIPFEFFVCRVEGYRIILKVSCRSLGFTLYKAFSENKKRSGISLRTSFSEGFLKKNVSLVIFYQLTKFHCLVVFTLWDIGQYLYDNCLLKRLWCYKIWS